jgi:hypothetical protein
MPIIRIRISDENHKKIVSAAAGGPISTHIMKMYFGAVTHTVERGIDQQRQLDAIESDVGALRASLSKMDVAAMNTLLCAIFDVMYETADKSTRALIVSKINIAEVRRHIAWK